MRVNKQYYLPLLTKFCEEAEKIGNGAFPRHGIFIPYTFENYDSAPIKIFYVGRDTAGWITFQEMMDDHRIGKLDDYLEKNSNVVTVQGENINGSDTHSLREGWNVDNRCDFWRFCQKLHLYIVDDQMNVDITQLSEDDYKIIEQMGYGNLNSLEVYQTLKNNKYAEKTLWEMVGDKKKLRTLRKRSRELDKIKHILDAYEPDLIIILNWSGKPEIVFKDLDTKNDSILYSEEKGKQRSVFTIDGYKTKIVWSIHPNSFGRQSVSPNEMLIRIGDTAKELLRI